MEEATAHDNRGEVLLDGVDECELEVAHELQVAVPHCCAFKDGQLFNNLNQFDVGWLISPFQQAEKDRDGDVIFHCCVENVELQKNPG